MRVLIIALIGVAVLVAIYFIFIAPGMQPVRVEIPAFEPGTTVRVTGEGRDETIRAPGQIFLRPGTYRFDITAPGFEPESLTAEVARGRLPDFAAVRLRPSAIALDLRTQPGGARVVIDGTEVGTTPYQGTITPGRHRIRIFLPGYRTLDREMDFRAPYSIDQALEALPPVTLPADAIRIQDGRPFVRMRTLTELVGGYIYWEEPNAEGRILDHFSYVTTRTLMNSAGRRVELPAANFLFNDRTWVLVTSLRELGATLDASAGRFIMPTGHLVNAPATAFR
jgi:hypothetical protein